MLNTSLNRLIVGGILMVCAGTVLAKETAQSTVLLIKKYPITVDGKKTQLFRIEQPDGTWGYHGMEGEFFDAVVKNTTDKPTVIHWHGLIVPNDQDGVPYVTQKPIPPGGEYHYRFKLKQSGTYWMHSHHDLQVQQFLSAPFVISEPQEDKTTKQVTLFIGDFSYKSPEAIFSELKKGNMTHSGAHMNHNAMVNMDSMKMDKPCGLVRHPVSKFRPVATQSVKEQKHLCPVERLKPLREWSDIADGCLNEEGAEYDALSCQLRQVWLAGIA